MRLVTIWTCNDKGNIRSRAHVDLDSIVAVEHAAVGSVLVLRGNVRVRADIPFDDVPKVLAEAALRCAMIPSCIPAMPASEEDTCEAQRK